MSRCWILPAAGRCFWVLVESVEGVEGVEGVERYKVPSPTDSDALALFC